MAHNNLEEKDENDVHVLEDNNVAYDVVEEGNNEDVQTYDEDEGLNVVPYVYGVEDLYNGVEDLYDSEGDLYDGVEGHDVEGHDEVYDVVHDEGCDEVHDETFFYFNKV